jgi:Ala-tRNA(Pro) deacylase
MKTLASDSLTALLDAKHVSYDVIRHRHTETAAAEARAIRVDPAQVAKTLVLVTEGGRFVRAVLPANERIDLEKVMEALGGENVQLAPEQVLAGAYPDFELGAVPPLGGAAGDRVLVDVRVKDAPSTVFEAGTHELSVRIDPADLISVADAIVADVCVG